MRGRIEWYNAHKGFGWIVSADGALIYLSASALPWGWTPSADDAVEFTVLEGPAGAQAVGVQPLTAGSTADKPRKRARGV